MQSFISELIFLFEFEFEALLLNSYSIRIQNFVSGLLFKFKTSFRVGRTILIRIYCGFLLECKFDYYTISKFRFQILIRIRISLGFRLRIRKWSFEFEFEQLVGNQALNSNSNLKTNPESRLAALLSDFNDVFNGTNFQLFIVTS